MLIYYSPDGQAIYIVGSGQASSAIGGLHDVSDHSREGSVRWRRPRRCLRVELANVAPCGEGGGVAGVRKIAEEREGRGVRATRRGERRGNERVASSLGSVSISLALPSAAFLDACRISHGEDIERNATSNCR